MNSHDSGRDTGWYFGRDYHHSSFAMRIKGFRQTCLIWDALTRLKPPTAGLVQRTCARICQLPANRGVAGEDSLVVNGTISTWRLSSGLADPRWAWLAPSWGQPEGVSGGVGEEVVELAVPGVHGAISDLLEDRMFRAFGVIMVKNAIERWCTRAGQSKRSAWSDSCWPIFYVRRGIRPQNGMLREGSEPSISRCPRKRRLIAN